MAMKRKDKEKQIIMKEAQYYLKQKGYTKRSALKRAWAETKRKDWLI